MSTAAGDVGDAAKLITGRDLCMAIKKLAGIMVSQDSKVVATPKATTGLIAPSMKYAVVSLSSKRLIRIVINNKL